MEVGNIHQETATNPMMSLDSCRKFLLVVRDFPPGCGSAAKNQQAVVCVDSGTKPMETVVGSQKPIMNAGNALEKRQGAGPIKVQQEINKVVSERSAVRSSGIVKNVVPRMDGLKKTPSCSLGSKSSLIMSRGSEMAMPRNGPRPTDHRTTHSSIHGGVTARDRVQECLRVFRDICRSQVEENKKLVKKGEKAVRRVDLHAYKQLKKKGKLVNVNQQKPGHVPGVNIGDTFYYRMELFAVGVHHQVQNGIDCMTYMGQTVATSVVASRSGLDDLSNPNALVYGGEGGSRNGDKYQDQQLTCGNLGLKNSIHTKTPVRVIRKVSSTLHDMELATSVPEIFVYDGLYTVETLEEDRPFRNKVYKFILKRVEGQPPIHRY